MSATSAPSHSIAWQRWMPILVIALGVGVRLWDLNAKSLWIDEVISFDVAANRPFLGTPTPLGSVVGHCLHDRGPGPLTYAGEWIALHLWKDERALRWPTAIFGGLGLVALWGLLRRLIQDERALIGGLLLWALLQPQVAYAQDARGYALASLVCILALWAAVRLWQGGPWTWWWAVIGLHLLAFFTSYFSAIQLGALTLATLWHRGWIGGPANRAKRLARAGTHVVGGVIIFLIPTVVWLMAMLPRAFPTEFEGGGGQRALTLIPSQAGWRAYLWLWRAALGDLVGAGFPLWPQWVGIALWIPSVALWAGLGVTGLLWRGLRSPWPILWVALALGPLLLVTLFATGHFLAPRYLFFAQAPLCLLAAWGIEALLTFASRRPPWGAIAFGALGAVIIAVSAPRLLHLHAVEKANWRGAVSELLEEVQPGDIVVGGPNADISCIGFYVDTRTGLESWAYFDWQGHPQLPVDEVLRRAERRPGLPLKIMWEGVNTWQRLRDLMASGHRIWFLTAHWGTPHRSSGFWRLIETRFDLIGVYEGEAHIHIWRFEPSDLSNGG